MALGLEMNTRDVELSVIDIHTLYSNFNVFKVFAIHLPGPCICYTTRCPVGGWLLQGPKLLSIHQLWHKTRGNKHGTYGFLAGVGMS